jgi:hypothetical protein
MVFILVIVSNTTRFQTRDPKVRKYLSEKCIALLCNFKKKINPILMELFFFLQNTHHNMLWMDLKKHVGI